MSNQYFENNPTLEHNIKDFTYYCYPNSFVFSTDLGVFSKDKIDFGSNLLIQNIKIKNELTILDCGCGYGIIGLVLAKNNPNITVDMVDVNLRALDLAKLNKEKNRIVNANIFESNAYSNIDKTYDLIVTNPPIRAGKVVVDAICLGAINHLNDGGKVILVIQKKQGAPSLINRMKEVYKEVNIITKDKGYYIIEGIK